MALFSSTLLILLFYSAPFPCTYISAASPSPCRLPPPIPSARSSLLFAYSVLVIADVGPCRTRSLSSTWTSRDPRPRRLH
ncbi:hypothetical protein OF83DRAFT_490282 [Amylostereum chailletii]|nr:hypothetical protein OF83DRAFT_490282 [Amylostereum chailletii]